MGNNKTWLDQADQIILEVNLHQSLVLEGMHDIDHGTHLPPHRLPIGLTQPQDRIEDPYLRLHPSKVIAVVVTDQPDRNASFDPPGEV